MKYSWREVKKIRKVNFNIRTTIWSCSKVWSVRIRAEKILARPYEFKGHLVTYVSLNTLYFNPAISENSKPDSFLASYQPKYVSVFISKWML